MYNLDNQSFEGLLKTLVSTHKSLISRNCQDKTSLIYTSQSKVVPMYEYVSIFTYVRHKPMKFLALDNKYFGNFQQVSELMECADNSFRIQLNKSGEREKEYQIKLFRASIIEKASTETRAYYTKIGAIPNQNTRAGKKANPNGEGK